MMEPHDYLKLADEFAELMYEAKEPRHRLAIAVQWFNQRQIEEILALFGGNKE